jgi:hypothetical protein
MPGTEFLVLARTGRDLTVLDPATGEPAATVRSSTLAGATSVAARAVDGGVLVAAGRDNGAVDLELCEAGGGTRPAGTLVSGRDGAAFLAADGRSYTATGEVGDVLWWAAGLQRFEVGELDRYAGITRLLDDTAEGKP